MTIHQKTLLKKKKMLVAVHEDETLEEGDERLPAGMSGPSAMGVGGGASALLNLDELVISEEIGRGAFSVVFRGTFRGDEVAIKRMPLADKDAMKYLEAEVALLTCVGMQQVCGPGWSVHGPPFYSGWLSGFARGERGGVGRSPSSSFRLLRDKSRPRRWMRQLMPHSSGS